jgi:hypothetical protein
VVEKLNKIGRAERKLATTAHLADLLDGRLAAKRAG